MGPNYSECILLDWFNCLPYFFKNVLPVQKAASRTLCIFLRYNRKQEQRHEVIQKLIERK